MAPTKEQPVVGVLLGLPCSGKSTALKNMLHLYEETVRGVFEPKFDLDDYYGDLKTYAASMQEKIVTKRSARIRQEYRQHKANCKAFVTDGHPLMDNLVFRANHFQRKNITPEQNVHYVLKYREVTKGLPKVDVYFVLECPVTTCLTRIRNSRPTSEQTMDDQYLRDLYAQQCNLVRMLKENSDCRVVTINSELSPLDVANLIASELGLAPPAP